MDRLALTPSQMTNEDVLYLIEHLPDLRRDVWMSNGVREYTYRETVEWLDKLGLTTREGRTRVLSVPIEEARSRILANSFEKRKTRQGQPNYQHSKVWRLIQPGPTGLFARGALFTVLEVKTEIDKFETDGYTIFADGSRFEHTRTRETAYWYRGQLWKEGEKPQPYYK